jgi:hypothetical protein
MRNAQRVQLKSDGFPSLTTARKNAINRLFRLTGTPTFGLSTFVDNQTFLNQANEIAQKYWLRKKGQERWHCLDNERLTWSRGPIIEALREGGFIDAFSPVSERYDHVLLLGAHEQRVTIRLQYLIALIISEKITVHHISLLGSQRALSNGSNADLGELEPTCGHGKFYLGKFASAEAEMMQVLYRAARFDYWQHLQRIPYAVFDSRMKFDHEGKPIRPTTVDTIRDFDKQFLVCGKSVLVVSNQPFCLYQDAVVRKVLPAGTRIDTIGNKIDESTMKVSIALDAVARYIYTLIII